MWAPKTLNTKSNSHGSSCFVFYKVSHLKHIPLKACFTKLGSYTMKKLKKRREKRQPISSLPFSSIYRLLFGNAYSLTDRIELIFNLPLFHPKLTIYLFFKTAVGRRPTDGGGIFSTKVMILTAFSQNGIRAAL